MSSNQNFHSIINQCLLDICIAINSSDQQIEIIAQKIQKLDDCLKDNNSECILKLIEQNNALLWENFCLITEQKKLIEYYEKIITALNEKDSSCIKKLAKDNVIEGLIEHYNKQKKHKNVSALQSLLVYIK